MVLSTLQTLSLIVGISYYLIILNTQQKNQKITLETRQAGIFTQLAFHVYTKEAVTDFYELMNWEWNDPQDFFNKYGSGASRVDRIRLFLNFDLIGRLLREGLIDRLLVSQLLGTAMLTSWTKFESIIKEERKRITPVWMCEWEYAVQEIMHVNEQTNVPSLQNN